MPIIIIFDPSGSCVIFARSIYNFLFTHKKVVIFVFIHCNIYSYCLLPNKCDSSHTDHVFGIISGDFVRINRNICKLSDQKILYSIKVKSKKAFFLEIVALVHCPRYQCNNPELKQEFLVV